MKKLIALVSIFTPFISFAAADIVSIDTLTSKITKIGTTVTALLIGFAVIWIIINIVRYLIAGGEDDRKKGGMAILYGVVGLFLIFSIWGLVFILTNSFSTQNEGPSVDKINQLIPKIPGIK